MTQPGVTPPGRDPSASLEWVSSPPADSASARMFTSKTAMAAARDSHIPSGQKKRSPVGNGSIATLTDQARAFAHEVARVCPGVPVPVLVTDRGRGLQPWEIYEAILARAEVSKAEVRRLRAAYLDVVEPAPTAVVATLDSELQARNPAEFAQLLFLLRERAGLQGTKLAERAGLSTSQLYSITDPERGRAGKVPTKGEQVRSLVTACGLSADQVTRVMRLWDEVRAPTRVHGDLMPGNALAVTGDWFVPIDRFLREATDSEDSADPAAGRSRELMRNDDQLLDAVALAVAKQTILSMLADGNVQDLLVAMAGHAGMAAARALKERDRAAYRQGSAV